MVWTVQVEIIINKSEKHASMNLYQKYIINSESYQFLVTYWNYNTSNNNMSENTVLNVRLSFQVAYC